MAAQYKNELPQDTTFNGESKRGYQVQLGLPRVFYVVLKTMLKPGNHWGKRQWTVVSYKRPCKKGRN